MSLLLERPVQLAIAVALLPVIGFAYLVFAEAALSRLSTRSASRLRPWVWLGPALAFLAIFLVAPIAITAWSSVQESPAGGSVGLANFRALIFDETARVAMGNSLLWLVFLTVATVTLGLGFAVLTDRVRYERIAKSIVFLPLAISFVAAGVIWRFMYDFRAPGQPQTGTLNAVVSVVVPGASPQPWLTQPSTNNAALIFAAVWTLTGICVVILSAALKAIPGELIEAARIDGASEWQVFRRILTPLLAPAILVVATTMAITSLKAFDLVYVLTNGAYGTDVLATRMYSELFRARDIGGASAIAVVMLIATIPIVAVNLRTFTRQEAGT